MVGRWGQGHFTWSRTHVRTRGPPPPQGQWSEEDVFVSRAATDVTTHVQYTHPDRANQAACGTNVADDKWDKALPSDDSWLYLFTILCKGSFHNSRCQKMTVRWTSAMLVIKRSASKKNIITSPSALLLIHRILGGQSTLKTKTHQRLEDSFVILGIYFINLAIYIFWYSNDWLPISNYI